VASYPVGVRLNADIERDLARLADGTLTPERARMVEEQIADSPELGELLDAQRRSLTFTRTLDDPAPAGLRTRIGSMKKRPAPRLRVRRAGFAAGLVAAAAVAAIAVVAILPGAGGPTLSEASALTLKPATAPAPAHQYNGRLNLTVDGVGYPYWEDELGWHAVGRRIDKLDGRTATTVFYKKGHMRVGYTIVTGDPVSVKGNPDATVRHGVRFRSLPLHGTTVVTWERNGHSCILSGAGVAKDKLLKLAAWKD
jgi:hypothetical protein